MREEWKIKRSGRDYVLYPGLLNEVHQRFVGFSLSTNLLEISERPIVQAYFSGRFKDREGKWAQIETTGTGTAGRTSDTSGAAAEAPLEMAETRAKARALRDAVNIGETAFEELSSTTDEALDSEAKQISSRRAHPPRRGRSPEAMLANEGSKVTQETLDEMKVMLFEDAKYKDVSLDERIKALEDYQGYPIDEMPEAEARGWIAQFEQMLRHRQEIDRAPMQTNHRDISHD